MRLSEHELLGEVRRAGHNVTPRQLRRWRDRGLVPSPTRERAPVRGSVYTYDDWVVEQVAAVAHALARTRSAHDALIGLWWDGRWVARDRLREALLAPLEELQRQAQAIVDSASDDLDAAEALARVVANEARAGRGWGLIGQRLGRGSDDRHSVATAVMLAALGGRPAWEVADTPGTPTLGDILNKATGIEQALHDGIDDGSPWLKAPPDLDEHFASVYAAGASDLLRVTAPISEATDEELDHVRDFAHTLSEAVVPWVAELERLHGVDAGGIASMREMLSAARTSDRILLVHWILTTRHLWLRDAPVEQS